MSDKKTSLKYKGYLIIKDNGYCFLYDRDADDGDYPIAIDKDLSFIREVVDKLSLSPKLDTRNTFLN